jgi:hypothetical protein
MPRRTRYARVDRAFATAARKEQGGKVAHPGEVAAPLRRQSPGCDGRSGARRAESPSRSGTDRGSQDHHRREIAAAPDAPKAQLPGRVADHACRRDPPDQCLALTKISGPLKLSKIFVQAALSATPASRDFSKEETVSRKAAGFTLTASR